MSAEGAKEHVSLVPLKSKLPTYFRFSEAPSAYFDLSLTNVLAMTLEKNLEMAELSVAM